MLAKTLSPSSIKEEYLGQPSPNSDWNSVIDRDMIIPALEMVTLAQETYGDKMPIILEMYWNIQSTWDEWKKANGWTFRNGRWTSENSTYQLVMNVLDWNQETEYAYCRNAVPEWSIDLSEHSCKGIILYHFDENTTSVEHNHCQWEFATDPKMRTIIEYHKPTYGEINIAMGVVFDEIERQAKIFGNADFHPCVVDPLPILNFTFTETKNLIVAVEKVTEKSDYSIVISPINTLGCQNGTDWRTFSNH